MVKWKREDGTYLSKVGEDWGQVMGFYGQYWNASYGATWLGKFKTLRRAKAWIEEVAPLIDEGGDYDTGPESERGPDWFGNDGIDYREAA